MQKYINKLKANPKIALLGLSVVLIIIIAILIVVAMTPQRTTISKPLISPEEETEVLTEIIKNNPSGLIKNKTVNTPVKPELPNTNNNVPDNNIPEDTSKKPPVAPDLNEYNYRVTKTTQEAGNAYKLCSYGYGYGGHGGWGYYPSLNEDSEMVSEYYEYFERYATYTKNLTKENNQLTNFGINKYGRTVNSQLYYLEGEYAVENSYKPYSGFDNQDYVNILSYPKMELTEYLKNYFGEGASIIDIFKNSNGEKKFKLKSTFKSFCDPSYDPYLINDNIIPPLERTIISIYEIDGTTFSINKVSRYLDEVKMENLIDITTTDFSRSKVNLAQVKDIFSVGSGVRLVKNDYTNLVYSYDLLNEIIDNASYLSNKVDKILLPGQYDSLSGLWAVGYQKEDYVDTNLFFKDRKFYPKGSFGDDLFEKYNAPSYRNDNSVYSLSLKDNSSNYYYLRAYNSDTSIESLKNKIMEVNATSKSLSSSKIMIGGEEVKLDKIAITYKYIYPDTLTSYPVSYSNTNTNNYFYYLFEFDGRVYSIDSTNDIIENKELFIYSTSTQNDVNKLNFDLIRLFKNYYPYYKPASYPATR